MGTKHIGLTSSHGIAHLVEHSTWIFEVVGLIPGLVNLTITNRLSDVTLKPRNRITILYTEHEKESGGALGSFALYPCTILRNN